MQIRAEGSHGPTGLQVALLLCEVEGRERLGVLPRHRLEHLGWLGGGFGDGGGDLVEQVELKGAVGQVCGLGES